MTSSQVPAGPARVTLVTAQACHFCDDAREALDGLGREYFLTVEETAAVSPAGRALLHEHGTGMFPLVLVDGKFFAAGRLPRRKLTRLLAARGATATAGAGAR